MTLVIYIIAAIVFALTISLALNNFFTGKKCGKILLYGFLILGLLSFILNSCSEDDSYSIYESLYSQNQNTNTRTKALSKSEADALRGSGYHNTRPNSPAENMELRAAQVKCKKCGYHSDNGSNSLCDYCYELSKYSD